MAYKVYTRKSFDKDLKKCIIRGFDWSKLNEVKYFVFFLKQEHCLHNIEHTNYPVTMKAVGNVIFLVIGCLYGSRMITN